MGANVNAIIVNGVVEICEWKKKISEREREEIERSCWKQILYVVYELCIKNAWHLAFQSNLVEKEVNNKSLCKIVVCAMLIQNGVRIFKWCIANCTPSVYSA